MSYIEPKDVNRALKIAHRIIDKRHLSVILKKTGWYDAVKTEFARELRRAYKQGEASASKVKFPVRSA